MNAKKIKELEKGNEDFNSISEVQFSFRQGFPGRVSARLENIIAEDPSIYFLRGLSNLLPKILVLSAVVILLFTIGLIVSNAEMNMEAFLGTQTLDENNFISYLILE